MLGKICINQQEFEFKTMSEEGGIKVTLNGKAHVLQVEEHEEKFLVHFQGKQYCIPRKEEQISQLKNGQVANVLIDEHLFDVMVKPQKNPQKSQVNLQGADDTAISAFMPGTIIRIDVREGQEIASGTLLLTLEAMKMENEIKAPCDCIIRSIHVQEGASVTKGELLVQFDPIDAKE